MVAIRVAERDGLDIVADERVGGRGEIVSHFVPQQRQFSRDDIHQAGLSTSVFTHDGNLFSLADAQIYRSLGAVKRMSGHSLNYFYYFFLHDVSL